MFVVLSLATEPVASLITKMPDLMFVTQTSPYHDICLTVSKFQVFSRTKDRFKSTKTLSLGHTKLFLSLLKIMDLKGEGW